MNKINLRTNLDVVEAANRYRDAGRTCASHPTPARILARDERKNILYRAVGRAVAGDDPLAWLDGINV